MASDPPVSSPTPARSFGDRLAYDRTVMANERTVLSYIRTALALVALGASGVELFDALWIQVMGVACLVLGAAVAIIGGWRYRIVQRRLGAMHVRAAVDS